MTSQGLSRVGVQLQNWGSEQGSETTELVLRAVFLEHLIPETRDRVALSTYFPATEPERLEVVQQGVLIAKELPLSEVARALAAPTVRKVTKPLASYADLLLNSSWSSFALTVPQLKISTTTDNTPDGGLVSRTLVMNIPPGKTLLKVAQEVNTLSEYQEKLKINHRPHRVLISKNLIQSFSSYVFPGTFPHQSTLYYRETEGTSQAWQMAWLAQTMREVPTHPLIEAIKGAVFRLLHGGYPVPVDGTAKTDLGNWASPFNLAEERQVQTMMIPLSPAGKKQLAFLKSSPKDPIEGLSVVEDRKKVVISGTPGTPEEKWLNINLTSIRRFER